MNLILKLWTGKFSLPKTYWYFTVLASILLGIPISFLEALADSAILDNFNILFIFYVLIGSYGLIALVGLWRSSNNYIGLQLWAILSKLVALFQAVLLLFSIVVMANAGVFYAYIFAGALLAVVAYLSSACSSIPNTKDDSLRPGYTSNLKESTNKTEITKEDSEDLWEKVSKEFNSKSKKEGLWTKCFVESNGDESKAKIQYLKTRYEQLNQEAKNRSQQSDISSAILSEITTTLQDSPAPQAGKTKSFSETLRPRKISNVALILLAVIPILITVIAVNLVSKYLSQNPISLPTFSGIEQSSFNARRDYLRYEVSGNRIKPKDMNVQVINDLKAISALPAIENRKILSRTEVLEMEHNNVWWVEKNTFYVRVFNPYKSDLMSFTFSLYDGACSNKKVNKTYLYFDLGTNKLDSKSAAIYKAELPFNYKDKFGSNQSLICGDMEGGWAK